MGNICDIFSKNNQDIYSNNYNNIDIGIPVEEYNYNKTKYYDTSYNINSDKNYLNSNSNQHYHNSNQHPYYYNQQPYYYNQQPYYYNDTMVFAMEGFMSGVLVDELIGD